MRSGCPPGSRWIAAQATAIAGSRSMSSSGRRASKGRSAGPAAGQHDVEPPLAREVGREAPFLGRNRVADGLDGVIVLGVPARRARVQLLALTAWPGREAAAQQLEEEAMAAVPLTPGIERDQEAVAPLEIGEDLPAAVRVEQRVNELPAQLVRDRGAHEEVAEVVGSALETLACEVVGRQLRGRRPAKSRTMRLGSSVSRKASDASASAPAQPRCGRRVTRRPRSATRCPGSRAACAPPRA